MIRLHGRHLMPCLPLMRYHHIIDIARLTTELQPVPRSQSVFDPPKNDLSTLVVEGKGEPGGTQSDTARYKLSWMRKFLHWPLQDTWRRVLIPFQSRSGCQTTEFRCCPGAAVQHFFIFFPKLKQRFRAAEFSMRLLTLLVGTLDEPPQMLALKILRAWTAAFQLPTPRLSAHSCVHCDFGGLPTFHPEGCF